MAWFRGGLAILVLVAGMMCATGASAVTLTGTPISLHHLRLKRTPEFCVQAGAAKLQELGYYVWRPTGRTVWARGATDYEGIGLLCGHEDGPLLVLRDSRGSFSQRTKAGQDLQRAVQAAIDPKDSAAPAPVPAAWFTGQIEVLLSVKRVVADRPVRCLTLARQALTPLGYKYLGATNEKGSEVGGGGVTTLPGVFLSCDPGGELIVVLETRRGDGRDREAAWAKAQPALLAAMPAAEVPPNLVLTAFGYTGAVERCMSLSDAVFAAQSYRVSRPAQDAVYGDAYDATVATRCAPGDAMVADAGHNRYGSYSADQLRKALAGAPVGPPSSPGDQAPNRPRLATNLQWRTTDIEECRDAGEAALKSLGYTPEPNTGPHPDTPNYRFVMAERDTFGVSAGIACARTWYGIAAAFGRTDLPILPEMQKLQAALLEQMTRPQWRLVFVGDIRVQLPRAPARAAGEERVVSRFGGADYVAWQRAVPADGPFDADAALEAQKAALEQAGASIVQAQRSPFKDAASIVVWTVRPGPDGRPLRGAARYVAARGKLYAIEVFYPEGADPAEAMKTFSDSLQIIPRS